MRLTEILQPDCVKVPLAATTKQESIFELVDLLADCSGVSDSTSLRQAVWQRETTRTTGIGHGIGIPHGKSDGVDRLRMAIGRMAKPCEFGAIDGRPVDLIILLVSPLDQTGPHIQALAKISRLLTSEKFRAAMRSARDGETLYKLIVQHEAETTV